MRLCSLPLSDASRSSCGDVSGRRRDAALSRLPRGRTTGQRRDELTRLDDIVIEQSYISGHGSSWFTECAMGTPLYVEEEVECCVFDHRESGGYIETKYNSLTSRPP